MATERTTGGCTGFTHQFTPGRKAQMGMSRSEATADLPPGMIIRRRANADYYHYQTSSVGQTRREYSLGKVKSVALSKWREIAAPEPVAVCKVGLRPWVGKLLYRAARANAKRRGIPFDLTLDDVEGLIAASNGKCALTGIPFDLFKDANCRVRHWTPSLDRVDSKAGYTTDNVRLIVSAANIALSDFGEDVLLRIAKGMIRVKYGKIV